MSYIIEYVEQRVRIEDLPHDVDADKVLKWALGEHYGNMAILSTDDRWNELHGDLFLLKGSDRIEDGLKRIVHAYKEQFHA